jgi:hypothetical protein
MATCNPPLLISLYISQICIIELFRKAAGSYWPLSEEFCEDLRETLANSKKGIQILKRIVHALLVFKEVSQIQKHLELSG